MNRANLRRIKGGKGKGAGDREEVSRGTPLAGGGGEDSFWTEDARHRVAGFFILLDQMDRAHARGERKAA